MDPLLASLLDLLREFDAQGVPLTVGGGFGLYLKRLHLAQTGERTLFSVLPAVRSTNDIDMFLRADVLADYTRTKEVADAVRRLGYSPVEKAKFLQWKRSMLIEGVSREVKLDVLVGPLGRHRESLKTSRPRARPKGRIEFHAHMVEEALHVEDHPTRVAIEGQASDGSFHRGTVLVPDAFPYLMMKLHAFRDRKEDSDKDLGRHHALDVYTIVGMMTEAEFERAGELGRLHQGDENVERTRTIVLEDFSSPTAMGVLRLREHTLSHADFQIEDLTSVLSEIFA